MFKIFFFCLFISFFTPNFLQSSFIQLASFWLGLAPGHVSFVILVQRLYQRNGIRFENGTGRRHLPFLWIFDCRRFWCCLLSSSSFSPFSNWCGIRSERWNGFCYPVLLYCFYLTPYKESSINMNKQIPQMLFSVCNRNWPLTGLTVFISVMTSKRTLVIEYNHMTRIPLWMMLLVVIPIYIVRYYARAKVMGCQINSFVFFLYYLN